MGGVTTFVFLHSVPTTRIREGLLFALYSCGNWGSERINLPISKPGRLDPSYALSNTPRCFTKRKNWTEEKKEKCVCFRVKEGPWTPQPGPGVDGVSWMFISLVLLMSDFISSSYELHKLGASLITAILHVRALRHREVKLLVQKHILSKRGAGLCPQTAAPEPAGSAISCTHSPTQMASDRERRWQTRRQGDGEVTGEQDCFNCRVSPERWHASEAGRKRSSVRCPGGRDSVMTDRLGHGASGAGGSWADHPECHFHHSSAFPFFPWPLTRRSHAKIMTAFGHLRTCRDLVGATSPQRPTVMGNADRVLGRRDAKALY